MPQPNAIQCAAATLNGRQCSRLGWMQGVETTNLCTLHRRANNVRLFANLREEEVRPPRPTCRECARPALRNLEHCRVHEALRPRPDLPIERRCFHPGCTRASTEHNRCVRHVTGFVRRQRVAIWHDMYIPGMVMVADNHDAWTAVVEGWRGRVGDPFIDDNFVRHLEINLARELMIPELWNLHMGEHAMMNAAGQIAINEPNRPPPRTELEGFVRDGQNVHTRYVTQQTNTSLDLLLNTDVPSSQNTVKETHMSFMEHIVLDRITTSLEQIGDVDRDVKRWYRTSTCRTEGDYLYKRTLDGLWARIKESSERKELEIRLWQEMVDSLGMCCDGHISRLTNVLCGFDSAFAPKLSPAEQLQNKMSVIAAADTPTLYKVAEALFVFRELNVPEDQWEAWVDAL